MDQARIEFIFSNKPNLNLCPPHRDNGPSWENWIFVLCVNFSTSEIKAYDLSFQLPNDFYIFIHTMQNYTHPTK